MPEFSLYAHEEKKNIDSVILDIYTIQQAMQARVMAMTRTQQTSRSRTSRMREATVLRTPSRTSRTCVTPCGTLHAREQRPDLRLDMRKRRRTW